LLDLLRALRNGARIVPALMREAGRLQSIAIDLPRAAYRAARRARLIGPRGLHDGYVTRKWGPGISLHAPVRVQVQGRRGAAGAGVKGGEDVSSRAAIYARLEPKAILAKGGGGFVRGSLVLQRVGRRGRKIRKVFALALRAVIPKRFDFPKTAIETARAHFQTKARQEIAKLRVRL